MRNNTDNSPLVSIVLPVYNGSLFLAESIESCINQTYTNWELIIVNDCSKDNSLEIATEFALQDKRIRIINNEVNKKLPASLNVGFEFATGEYFTWTSHDNRFHPDFIKVYVDYLDKHPETGFLTGTYQMMDENGKLLDLVALPDPQLYMPLYNPIAYAFMYRASVAKLAGTYNVNLFLVEDYEYWVRLWLHTKVARIEDCFYYTRVHGGTLTVLRKNEIAQKLLEMRLMYFEKFDSELKNYPSLRYKFFISLIDNAKGFQVLRLFFKLSTISPIEFGLKYVFIYKPKKILKSFNFYWQFKINVRNQ